MDSDVVNFMASVLPTVKNGQVAIFLFALGLVIPLIVAVFAIKWGWHAIWSVAQGKTDIVSAHYTDTTPAHDQKIGLDPIVKEHTSPTKEGDMWTGGSVSKYDQNDMDNIALFGDSERKRIDRVKASYPSLIKKLEAREKSWELDTDIIDNPKKWVDKYV